MQVKELIAQVKKIEIKTRRTVDELCAGAYRSVFKGRGIEFDEVREYTQDDDVRDIDWNVTARTGSPHIKKYIEERELNVVIAVDASSSLLFGSKNKTKFEKAIEISALLTFSAIRNHDKVALLFFTDKKEFYLPPKSGKSHGMRIIRELLARKYPNSKTNISSALSSLMNLLKKRAVIFLLTDLMDENDFSKEMRITAKKHDLIVVRILDRLEKNIPSSFIIEFEDSENGELLSFNGRDKRFIANFAKSADQLHKQNEEICKRAKVDLIDIECSEDILKPLMKFFKMREKFRK